MKNYEIFFESISCLLRPSIPRGWITDGGSRRIDAAAKQPIGDGDVKISPRFGKSESSELGNIIVRNGGVFAGEID